MPRHALAPLALILALLLAALAPAQTLAQQRDLAGSRDYPGIGRFAGSAITGYAAKDFDETRLQTAPFKDGRPTGDKRLEGSVTRIAYRTPVGPSMLEVYRNFTAQLEKAGYATLLACGADDCGGIPFSEAIDVMPIPLMWVDGFDYRYWSGKKEAGGRETWASVVVSTTNGEITAQLVVAVVGAMANRMIDAAAMAKGLGETGHIALYGIYFDTDKTVVKPESRPTLQEIAALLKAQPTLRVVIVGHTDTQGSYAHNLDLSKRRAAAVAAELTRSFGIPAARLLTDGVGYLAPVATNASEDGRALNRRVELVQW